jgi:hypothetical protein
MGQRNVRVVVGQGDLEHAGSLRHMLERDDFDVVGDAANTSQLARVLTDEQPDIVVLDDMIGIAAVQVAAEIVPDARLVVVWPAAVMPIAGAVRVDPSEVATTLTATVALAAGLSGLGAVDRPEWIERVKKDPATLREMLAARGALPARPSVTELQRRGHRLHPSPSAAKHAARSDDAAAAAVVPIGLAASQQQEPPDASDDAAVAAAGAVPPPVLSSAWNRRLGIIALGGAAAAGALMVALALGPHASNIVSAEPFPVTIQPAGGPPFTVGSGETQNRGGGNGAATTPGAGGGGSSAPGDATITGGSTSGTGSSPHGSLGGFGGGAGSGSGGSGSGGTGGSGSGSGGGASNGGPRADASHLPGSHGTGKPGVPGWRDATPGDSGDHNPHGGPPGHGSNPGHGSGNGGAHGSGNSGAQGGGSGSSTDSNGPGATHGNSAGHSHAGEPTHNNGHANPHASAQHGNSAAHRHKR